MAVHDRIERERDFWNHALPTVDEAVAEFERGPEDANIELMLATADPRPGRRIIDFACGSGVTSLWLAQRGATVTGIDLSPRGIEIAREAARRVGVDVNFEVANLEDYDYGEGYDAMIGKWALHHLDVAAIAPAMARCLKPNAPAAFVETMARNPILRLARKHLTGRFGIIRLGTLDEHPLVPADVEALRTAFGEVRIESPHFTFLRIFDRQVLRYRHRRISAVLGFLDDCLARLPVIRNWSYHQVLIATRTR